MKKFLISLVLLLLLPFCTVGDEPSSNESVVEDSIDTGSSEENNKEIDSSDSKSNDTCLLYTSDAADD